MLIVGLGNRGMEYASTRHNLGFSVVDRGCEELRIIMDSANEDCVYGVKIEDSRALVFIKPMTFMNNSGRAVVSAMSEMKINPDQLFVVADDFALPLGSIRIRERGSHGGQNGLRSIIENLGTEEFPRLRMGINPGHDVVDLSEFVLSPFRKDELEPVSKMVATATAAVKEFGTIDMVSLMSRYNN